jgi:LDH2 family malate/lactate/ureidoglycolate dehydrogenase
MENKISKTETRQENADFLEYVYKKLWLGTGACEEDAEAVARAISIGDRMGKLTQGMGVLDVLFLSLEGGNLDVKAVPQIVSEGPSWVVYDGKQATGNWTLTLATKKAIEKAREHGIGLAMARNHNDAGCFFAYTSLAIEQDMFAMATNNSVPLVSPWGGMENRLSGAPFCAAAPGGEEPPLVSDIACIEAHDGNISEAAYNNQKLKGKHLVNPETGELTDDPAPYIIPVEGYGRICGCSVPTVFDNPRLYAMNVFTEMLSTIIVPGSVITPELPHGHEAWDEPWGMGCVGGSFVLVIDPSHFGPISEVKDRSDRFARAVKSAKKRPGVEEIFLPGERGHRAWKQNKPVKILETHWTPFVERARKYGVDVEGLREEWRKTQ